MDDEALVFALQTFDFRTFCANFRPRIPLMGTDEERIFRAVLSATSAASAVSKRPGRSRRRFRIAERADGAEEREREAIDVLALPRLSTIGFRSSARVEQWISVSIRAIRGENRYGCGCAALCASVRKRVEQKHAMSAKFQPWAIGLVEGIIYLTKSDEEFYQTYIVGKKEWF
ncbi:MAG: hypothetical protein WD066_05605 [Planctomycetaceae bacterium]